MRITKDNINEYLDEDGDLNLYYNKQITHIDYLPNNISWIGVDNSNVKEITCKLPEGLIYFYCSKSKLKELPLLPKSLIGYSGERTNLPKEFQVNIWEDNIKCNNLRKLQMINSL